jgi:hypothetical protein
VVVVEAGSVGAGAADVAGSTGGATGAAGVGAGVEAVSVLAGAGASVWVPVSAGVVAAVVGVAASVGVVAETVGSALEDVVSVAASGGSSTCTVTVWPPSSVTVIVRSCAEAGKTAALKPAVNAPADMSPISSLRRLIRK